jgi:hypothetical protein|tara:strand:- start:757 stop:1392 length:636 start_codon:yes stop_codon:yes gene_type:complete
MPHYQFPTNYVYWENIKEHDNIKSKYMPILDAIEKVNKDNLENPWSGCEVNISSFSHDYNFLNTEDINTIIWKPIDNFISEINSNYKCRLRFKESRIYKYWFNTYKMGDFQEFHDHHGSPKFINDKYFYPMFSGIYILHDDTETSSIIFKTPNTIPLPFSDLTNPHYFNTSKENTIKEGTVVIFPSQLEHMVKKCIKPGRRTIAFNVISEL